MVFSLFVSLYAKSSTYLGVNSQEGGKGQEASSLSRIRLKKVQVLDNLRLD